MALKIRRNNTSILDTFNDEDIQKEYDSIKLSIIADDIDLAYNIYKNGMGVYTGYKPKSLKELKKWIWTTNNNNNGEVKDVSWFDVSEMTNLSYCFWFCTNITEIIGLENWDVSNVTNMLCMFNGCTKLKSLDLSNWDVKNVKGMWGMFDGCEKLTEIKGIENWDIRNVETLGDMFKGCNKSIIPSWYPE